MLSERSKQPYRLWIKTIERKNIFVICVAVIVVVSIVSVVLLLLLLLFPFPLRLTQITFTVDSALETKYHSFNLLLHSVLCCFKQFVLMKAYEKTTTGYFWEGTSKHQ